MEDVIVENKKRKKENFLTRVFKALSENNENDKETEAELAKLYAEQSKVHQNLEEEYTSNVQKEIDKKVKTTPVRQAQRKQREKLIDNREER